MTVCPCQPLVLFDICLMYSSRVVNGSDDQMGCTVIHTRTHTHTHPPTHIHICTHTYTRIRFHIHTLTLDHTYSRTEYQSQRVQFTSHSKPFPGYPGSKQPAFPRPRGRLGTLEIYMPTSEQHGPRLANIVYRYKYTKIKGSRISPSLLSASCTIDIIDHLNNFK